MYNGKLSDDALWHPIVGEQISETDKLRMALHERMAAWVSNCTRRLSDEQVTRENRRLKTEQFGATTVIRANRPMRDVAAAEIN